ncbi:MAG TPA: hypothetical protein VNH80_13290, partial [Burkholderiales bacterium]|nr:hypothetical protein [Burkholderiales bacterium]
MRWLRWLVRGAVALPLVAAAAALWLLETESGLRWALAFAPPGLEIEGARGALAGTMSFERVAYQGSEARKVVLDVNLFALAADTISVEFVRAESIKLQRPGESAGRTSTTLPFRVRIADAEVKSLAFEGYEVRDVRADYSGGASGHEAHASFSVDLAALDPELPRTALRLKVDGTGSASAFAGKLALVNAAPGPIDRGRLPFGRADAAFSTDFETISFERMHATLHPAGTIQGKGSATLERQTFELQVAGLDLRGFSSRLPESRLAGELELGFEPAGQRLKAKLAQQDLSLTGEASRLGKVVRFAADLTLAGFDPARFGDYPAASINGSFKVNGDLAGAGSAVWAITRSTLLGQSFTSGGTARLAGERVTQADAWLNIGANRATAKGSFGGPGDRVAWTLHVPDLATLAAGFGGEIRAHGSASGSWEAPRVALDAQASRLRLAEA